MNSVLTKDCKAVWGNCLGTIQGLVNEQSFKTWFAPIVPHSLQNNTLNIKVPNPLFIEYIEEHFIHALHEAIVKELGPSARLEYTVNHAVNKPAPNDDKNKRPFEFRNDLEEKMYYDTFLNPNYTFDKFIEGDCNKFARAASIAAAEKPGQTSFNPLMIYGGVGLGKTHLVQAIGNKIKADNPNKFVIYISSDKFIGQFTEFAQHNRLKEFEQFFRLVDVLIVDDVQFFAKKEKTQEMFFNIFNEMHQSRKQIILTSDCAPKDIVGLEERLLSRFKWGVSADLQKPDFETRVAIIKRKMANEGIEIPYNVVEYIAESVNTNIRELEGVLISLITQSVLCREEINLELAKSVLQNIIKDAVVDVNIDYIIKTVCEQFRITHEEIKSKSRKKEIVIPRQVAMYLAKEFTDLSLVMIGTYLGRDHSTVIHAITSVENMMDTDRKFKTTMQDVIKKLKMKSI